MTEEAVVNTEEKATTPSLVAVDGKPGLFSSRSPGTFRMARKAVYSLDF